MGTRIDFELKGNSLYTSGSNWIQTQGIYVWDVFNIVQNIPVVCGNAVLAHDLNYIVD